MSLKAFHYVFLTASILLTLIFGAWAIQEILQSGQSGGGLPIVYAVGAFVALGALFRYGVWVSHKLARESYL